MYPQIATQFRVETGDKLLPLLHRHDSHGFDVCRSQWRVGNLWDVWYELAGQNAEVLGLTG